MKIAQHLKYRHVYLVFMNDMCLGVRSTFRKAENVAHRVMRDQQHGTYESWRGWRQEEQGKARWHNEQVARLEIEPWRVQ